jgi:glycosyltransferase involved in cell wall biosynthesis
MNALLLSIADGGGGAARAAYRLHQGLRRQLDVAPQMLVQSKLTNDSDVLGPSGKIGKSLAFVRPTINALSLKQYPQCNSTTYSTQWLPDGLAKQIRKLTPDIVNLHWICDGFLRIETLAQLHRPLIWTLHDMWSFTGGCHYNGECTGFLNQCGTCPQLGSTRQQDISTRVWLRKAKTFQSLDLTLIAPSQWLGQCARSSSLFHSRRIEVIPYGLDTELYKPIARSLARQILNLPQDQQLILFGAIQATSDRRKGFHLLQPALQRLKQLRNNADIQIVVIGSSTPMQPIDLGFETHYLGTLKDDYSLALAYAAADVFVAPSVQDNLPNTVLEAIACGTPCVAFNIGGMPDLIEHEHNGYLAKPFEIEDFAQGINWILSDREIGQQLSEASRSKAEQEFTLDLQASRYRDLFHELLESSRKTPNH